MLLPHLRGAAQYLNPGAQRFTITAQTASLRALTSAEAMVRGSSQAFIGNTVENLLHLSDATFVPAGWRRKVPVHFCRSL